MILPATIPSVATLSVITLSVIRLDVDILVVVSPFVPNLSLHGAIPLSLTTFSIMTFSVTIRKSYNQHNAIQCSC